MITMKTEQIKSLNELKWANKKLKVVKIPIDQAMRNVVKTYNP